MATRDEAPRARVPARPARRRIRVRLTRPLPRPLPRWDGLTRFVRSGAFAADVLDATGCLVVVVDVASGVVHAVNQAVLDATGFDRGDVTGQPIAPVLMSDVDFARARSLHLRDSATCTGSPFEAPLLLRAGGRRRVLWAGKPLGTSRATSTYVVMSGLDLSADALHGGLVSHLLHAEAGSWSIATDLRGRVTYWSDEAETLLGHARDEMVGHPLPLTLLDAGQLAERAARAGLPPDLRVLTVDPRTFDRRSSRPLDLGVLDRRGRSPERVAPGAAHARAVRESTSWTLVRRDGAQVTVDAVVRPIRDSAGEPVGYVGVGTDVTAQQRTHDLLVSALARESRAAQSLRELDEAKDRLMATVSHELRTPLSSIDGYTELLEDGLGGELNDQQRTYVDAIRRNTDRLSRLVEDLLTLSDVEAGGDPRADDVFDLRTAVRAAWEKLDSRTRNRRLETSLELSSDPVLVRGDIVSLTRATWNLLDNAQKCTPDGGLIACTLTTHGDVAVLSITDTGFGIPLHEQDSLFARFSRTTTAQEREVQGSGLGLAITAEIVRRCGGTVSVASDHLAGAAFTITVPLVRSDVRRARVVS